MKAMRVRAGFTLLEVVVGLTVASLALAAGFGALGFVRDRSQHADEASRVAVAGAVQRNMLIEWLNGALLRAPTGEAFEGVDESISGENSDMVLVPTTARTPLEGSFTVVGLYIDDDPDTPQRGLVAEMTGTTFGSEPTVFEIVPQAGHMQIRYRPNSDGDIAWSDGWTAENGLPRAIEIVLTPVPGDSLPLLLRLPIRVALRASR